MVCKNCGTEIADKALVCYRCGHATFEPVRKPAAIGGRGRSIVVTLGVIVLMLAALFMGQAGTDEVPRIVSWTIAALAAVVLAWRLLVRRR
jgi:zinc-ribbon domain